MSTKQDSNTNQNNNPKQYTDKPLSFYVSEEDNNKLNKISERVNLPISEIMRLYVSSMDENTDIYDLLMIERT